MHRFTVFLLALTFISLEVSALPYKTLVAPITKDLKTSLYTITLNSRENYVIDINAPLSWRLCPNPYPTPVPCSAPQCLQGRSNLPGFCTRPNNLVIGKGQCLCIVSPANPVTKSCASSKLTYRNFVVSWTNGKNPTAVANLNRIYHSCAPSSLFKSLPQGVSGLAALSRAPLAFSSQFTPSYLGMTKKFAICLPGGNKSPGVSFFGDGPYNLLPRFSVMKVLSYTPLLKKSNSEEYYVGLKGISINGRETNFKRNAFAFDSHGNGGVKLSTVVPHTTLRSDVYKNFMEDFRWHTRSIPRAKTASPFNLCFKASRLAQGRLGFLVPTIDLEFGNGAKWSIYGANSMKLVGKDTACLAIVDGGKTAKEAVVIGSYQMENNFLLFDLAASKLGFSSSLFEHKTSCANFNFTKAA